MFSFFSFYLRGLAQAKTLMDVDKLRELQKRLEAQARSESEKKKDPAAEVASSCRIS